MSAEWIGQIVVAGEAETPEFMSTTGTRREATRTVRAMLNRQGGQVLIGVAPNGHGVGQQLDERIIEEIGAELQEIDLPAFPTAERIPAGHDREIVPAKDRDVKSGRLWCDDGPYFLSATKRGKLSGGKGLIRGPRRGYSQVDQTSGNAFKTTLSRIGHAEYCRMSASPDPPLIATTTTDAIENSDPDFRLLRDGDRYSLRCLAADPTSQPGSALSGLPSLGLGGR